MTISGTTRSILSGGSASTRRSEFSEFSVLAVPPDRLPDWISEQTWQAATFVEVMKPYWTTEGVYEYSVADFGNIPPLHSIAELANHPPRAVVDDIPEGFRGEYSLELGTPAQLYVSPIDGRAHLLDADAGVWNLGRGRQIRYESVGGDHVNHWTILERGRPVNDLYVAAGQILLNDATGTRVGNLLEPEAIATFAPPRDHEEWNKLSALLDKVDQHAEPDDFRGMFEAVAGAPKSLPGATIRDFRLEGDGFRFVLESTVRTPSWQGIDGPGGHLVQFMPGRGYVTGPLTPARLQVSAVSAVQEAGDTLEPVGLSATVGQPRRRRHARGGGELLRRRGARTRARHRLEPDRHAERRDIVGEHPVDSSSCRTMEDPRGRGRGRRRTDDRGGQSSPSR